MNPNIKSLVLALKEAEDKAAAAKTAFSEASRLARIASHALIFEMFRIKLGETRVKLRNGKVYKLTGVDNRYGDFLSKAALHILNNPDRENFHSKPWMLGVQQLKSGEWSTKVTALYGDWELIHE